MRAKKTKEADLESRRKGFLLIGLTVACAFSLTAFEWITPERSVSFIPPLPPFTCGPEPQGVGGRQLMKQRKEASDKIIVQGFTTDDIAGQQIDSEEGLGPDSDTISYEVVAEEMVDEFPFLPVEKMPNFIGGEEALLAFLREELVYPDIAVTGKEEGTVWISFVVNKKGKVTDIKVIRGVSPTLDREALRVVKMIPNWSPGIFDGEPVTFIYRLPVKFTLR